MFAEVVAIFSAMGWSGDSVLVRLGLRKSNIFAAMLVRALFREGTRADRWIISRLEALLDL